MQQDTWSLDNDPKNKHEYNICSSKDIVSAPKLVNDKIQSVLHPKHSKSHNITVPAKSNDSQEEETVIEIIMNIIGKFDGLFHYENNRWS